MLKPEVVLASTLCTVAKKACRTFTSLEKIKQACLFGGKDIRLIDKVYNIYYDYAYHN
jgi:hypothetical protein